MTAPVVTTPAPPAIPPLPPVDALTTRLIAQHGTVENALRHLVTASITTDAELGTLRREVADFKAKLPDGAIVLTKDAAANWTKLQDLKLTPEQIEAAVKKLPTLEGQIAASTAEKVNREVAAAAGLDPEGYAAYAVGHPLHTEWRDTPVVENGKTVTKKVAFVRPASDDKVALVAVSEYVGKLPAHEQRALKATVTAPVPTLAHPQQPTPSSSGPSGDIIGDEIKKQHERAANRPNPLFPARKPAVAGTAA